MPRKLRIQYPGAIYHVMNRGDQREEVFRDEADREQFLATLGQACGKTQWQVHAYCLMRNHFHLVLETPEPNLVYGMKWLLGTYTKRFNIRHKLCGHLFAGRYQALLVEGSGNGYLRTVCDYVHLNPVRAHLLPPEAPLQSYGWSSYGYYLKAPPLRPGWLRVDRLLGEKGIPLDSEAGRQQFAKLMESRRAQEAAAAYAAVRRDWILGSEEFRRELLAAASEGIGPTHYGGQRRETELAKAERLLKSEFQRLGWKEEALSLLPKGHPVKVQLARQLRQETILSLKWIASRLHMGSWSYLSNLLAEPPKPLTLCQNTLPLFP